jgi:hypothetical protein
MFHRRSDNAIFIFIAYYFFLWDAHEEQTRPKAARGVLIPVT